VDVGIYKSITVTKTRLAYLFQHSKITLRDAQRYILMRSANSW